jgi:hypothetical protein
VRGCGLVDDRNLLQPTVALLFGGGAVKVDVPPTTCIALPNASFLHGAGGGIPIGAEFLRQPHVGHDGYIFAAKSYQRRNHGGVARTAAAGQIEVIAMKGHAVDQMAVRFGLEAGDVWMAQFFVRFPIAGRNGIEQAFVQRQKFVSGGHLRLRTLFQ